jgi:hypothetical protein
MIEAFADLFVERVPRILERPVLAQASRLLVVDACGRPRKVADLTVLVERSAPVTASYVELAQIDSVHKAAMFELVWLFADDQSDLSYCGLYLRELEERFRGARVEVIGVGDIDRSKCELRLPASMVGAAPPWRRARELARAAAELTTHLNAARAAKS